MSAAQIAQQRRDSEAAEKSQRQLHAATEAVSALRARLDELTEEVASQAGQRQAAERIADALRAELMSARAAPQSLSAAALQEELGAKVRPPGLRGGPHSVHLSLARPSPPPLTPR